MLKQCLEITARGCCRHVFLVFRMFELNLGDSFYHGHPDLENRLVDMYHAGTPELVKQHIVNDLGDEEGHIRVLISTIAFGMGVNCKCVRQVIHLVPSKDLGADYMEHFQPRG